MTSLLEQLLGEEEDRSPTVYLDTSPRKLMTIAIGCVVDSRVPGAGLCDAAIDAQFTHDSASAQNIAGKWPNFTQANPVRQAVLISMAFQLGNKPGGWPNFMAALNRQDYQSAAAAGLDSDWAHEQTPKRAQREMAMLASGEWVAHT
jgi:lysozyme